MIEESGAESVPTRYLLLMDLDPGGPKISGSATKPNETVWYSGILPTSTLMRSSFWNRSLIYSKINVVLLMYRMYRIV
jgi:hypothetical protein